jgi:hypothetical protein
MGAGLLCRKANARTTKDTKYHEGICFCRMFPSCNFVSLVVKDFSDAYIALACFSARSPITGSFHI